jgi:hypothetical protein
MTVDSVLPLNWTKCHEMECFGVPSDFLINVQMGRESKKIVYLELSMHALYERRNSLEMRGAKYPQWDYHHVLLFLGRHSLVQ